MLRQIVFALAVVLVGSSVLLTSGIAREVAVDDLPAATHMVLAAGSSPMAGLPIGAAIHKGATDPRFEERVRHYLADHGLDHPQRLDLGDQTPLEAATTTLTQELRNGRTVVDWVKLARADNLVSLQPAAAQQPVDLVDAVARLDAAAGFPLTDAQMARVASQAAALPEDVRAPFALLVAATADAYVAQAPLASDIISRIGAEDGTAFFMSDAEREATLANALGLLAAQNAFRLAVEDVEFPASSTPLFADPNGLVFLGSTSADTYTRGGVRQDPALVVDPSGDDTYYTTAGSACPDAAEFIHDCNGLVASVVLDLAGNDQYRYSGAPTDSQGAASLGGIGVLYDVQGNDFYYTHYTQLVTPRPFWGGVTGYIDGGSQGYGLAAVGILLDPLGNDVWESDVTTTRQSVWALAQGFGNAGGIGIAADGTGNDEWLSYGFDSPGLRGFEGLYPGGSGFFGGLGIVTDTGLGNDKWYAWDNASSTDFYAYGFGAFGGTGIFFEDGGDDDYQAVESATGASGTVIIPLLNCAFGTASFAGLGVFLEMGGNDHYFGDTRGPRQVATMNEGFGGPAEGEGVFVDVSGDDGHFMEAHPFHGANDYEMTHGRGILLGGGEGLTGNTAGLYLDLMGADTYTGASPSRNNAAWPFGADLEAGSVPQFFVS